MNEEKLPHTLDITPNWESLFRFAISIVKAEIPEAQGQGVVVKMLEYGKRLHGVRIENIRSDLGRRCAEAESTLLLARIMEGVTSDYYNE